MSRPSGICRLVALVMSVGVAIVIGTAAGRAGAQGSAGGGIPIPEEWIGIWESQSTTRDCSTDSILFQEADVDTVCPGDLFDPETAGEVTCDGTITATTIDVQCSGSFEVFPGCTADVFMTQVGTRTDDTIETTTTVSTTFVGNCGLPDQCTRMESSSTRTNPDPGKCPPSPVRPATWGQVKVRYD